METKLLLFIYILLTNGELSPKGKKENHVHSGFIKDNHGNTYGDDSVEVESEDDGQILFNPTKEWQEVKYYHMLPPGLHIRINLQTGLKEAKLISEDDENKNEIAIPYIDSKDTVVEEGGNVKGEREFNPQESSPNEELRERIRIALSNIKNEDPEKTSEGTISSKKKSKFRSYDTLKAEFEDLNMKVQSESEILKYLINEYGNSEDEYKLNIIEDLDYLIHQIDNAVDFINMGGIQKIINPSLNSSNDEIRKGVMKLIGSASQSNPKVQIAAFEEGLINHLLRIVAKETDSSISSKAVFAISCLVRGFPYGQQKLIEGGGLHTLREVFFKQGWQSLKLQLKVVSLVQDLLEERVSAEGERARQLGKLDLTKSLVDGEWCSAITTLLSGVSFDKRGKREDLRAALSKEIPLRPDHDMVDKVVNTMSLMAPSCQDNFFSVIPILQSLKETYSDLAYKEKHQGEDGYDFFQGLANQIQYLLRKLSLKEEL